MANVEGDPEDIPLGAQPQSKTIDPVTHDNGEQTVPETLEQNAVADNIPVENHFEKKHDCRNVRINQQCYIS